MTKGIERKLKYHDGDTAHQMGQRGNVMELTSRITCSWSPFSYAIKTNSGGIMTQGKYEYGIRILLTIQLSVLRSAVGRNTFHTKSHRMQMAFWMKDILKLKFLVLKFWLKFVQILLI